jgi:glycosyltransferase involved in cell wall biosynthesis
LALSARAEGMAALHNGDQATAIRWLDRAHRLAPADPNIALALATAYLNHDDAAAAALFRAILATHDIREAWWGLATAWERLGRLPEAADAIHEALRRYSLIDGIATAAATIAAALGAQGWCGLTGIGAIRTGATGPGAIEIRLDGRRLAGHLPAKAWSAGQQITVTRAGRPLLGSPIDIRSIARLEGWVRPTSDGIEGWAWHPGDPETDPVLTIHDDTGRRVLKITASDDTADFPGQDGLSRPRAFHVPAARLAKHRGPFRIVGRDGRDLPGSPFDPLALALIEPVSVPPVFATDVRPVAVIVLLDHRTSLPMSFLDALLASIDGSASVIVVDDASEDPKTADALKRLADAGGIRWLRHDRPLGPLASANAGIATYPEHDVILLDQPVTVPFGWIERLRRAAYSAPEIATVTPLLDETADPAAVRRLGRLAMRTHGDRTVDISAAGVGCAYFKRSCLDAIGAFRPDLFTHGEIGRIDFSLRAQHSGWRHIALPGLLVAPVHKADEPLYQRLRDEPILNRLYPGHRDETPSALADARHRLNLTRWHSERPRGAESVILITHTDGGGVERRVADAANLHRTHGRWPVLLRPGSAAEGHESLVVCDGKKDGLPDLHFPLPAEMPSLLRLLRATRPAEIEVHHLLNHSPAIFRLMQRLGVPYEAHIHDYALVCPRISLVGTEHRYCGEPDLAGCEACVATRGRLVREDIGVAALRKRSAAFLAAARRVVVPSHDTATRLRRYIPNLEPVVVPHSDDSDLPAMRTPAPRNGVVRVCVAGGVGPHKGYDILLACARDAAERSLALEFVVVGDTTGDDALHATGKVFVSGTYRPEEAVELIRRQDASLAFLPSVWPETWSLTLTELWQAGLAVAAFDMGAPAERIRTTGRGLLLPFGLPVRAINNALLVAARTSGHEGPRRS